jgi:4-amino-4-deoxy-L-arabinose transferase-like glycosyltransferase
MTSRPGYRLLVAILVSSFALKLVLLIPAHETKPVRDAFSYVRTASILNDSKVYDGGRPPLYPFMLWTSMRVASVSIEARDPEPGFATRRYLDLARFIQVIFSTVTVWLIFLLGRKLFDRRAGLTAAALFAFYPDFVAYSHLLWAETQLVMLTVAWALLLIRGLRERRFSTLCLSGIFLGLASLTRPVVFFFVPAMVAWMFVAHRGSARCTLRACAAVVVACLLVISPWTVRNAVAYRAFVPITPQLGSGLLFGVSATPRAELRVALEQSEPQANRLEKDRLYRARAVEIIAADPARYARRMLFTNLPGLWAPGSALMDHLLMPYGYGPVPTALGRSLLVLVVGSYLAIMLLAGVGVALAPRWRETLLFAALALNTSAMHAVIGGFHRHRLFLMAFAIVYAGFALSRRRSELQNLVSRRRAVVGAGALLAFGLTLATSTAPWQSLRSYWQWFETPPAPRIERNAE